ncbi:MAG: type VI secretion system tip protein TssI/VgrG, partial [bacterium]|nr:type VI secretion system tip protein TssI/VgrG [bacterium]
DKYGRVKVKFHWDRSDASGEQRSCWIRVAQKWAGKSWGAVFIPRIGQEVLVDFLEGDPDRPIISGCVYNGTNVTPYELPKDQTVSTIMSNSSLGGDGYNEFKFQDKKGSEQIHIHAQKDYDTKTLNNKTASVGANETLKVGKNRSRSVGADESVSVAGKRSHSVSKDETISIGDNQSISIGKSLSSTVGKNESRDVSDNLNITTGKDSSESVGKKQTINVGDNRSLEVGKDYSIAVGKKYGLAAGDSITVSSDNEITLKCGSASISMKKNGDITIKGKKINIKGSGDVILKGSKVTLN